MTKTKSLKKVLRTALALLLMVSLVATCSSALTASADTLYKCTGNSVNFRKQPNTSSTVLGQFSKGEFLWKQSTSGSWYYGHAGWTSKICAAYGGQQVNGYGSTSYFVVA